MTEADRLYKLYRFNQAIKLGLCVAVALLLVLLAQIPNGFMLILVFTVIPTFYPHEVFARGIQRVFGAVGGGLIGIAIMILMPNETIATLAQILVLLVAGYLFASGVMIYSMVIGSITLSMVYFLSFTDPQTALVFTAYWMGLIVLGVAILFMLNLLAFPVIKKRLWRQHWKAVVALTRDALLDQQAQSFHDWGRYFTQSKNLFSANRALLSPEERQHAPRLLTYLKRLILVGDVSEHHAMLHELKLDWLTTWYQDYQQFLRRALDDLGESPVPTQRHQQFIDEAKALETRLHNDFLKHRKQVGFAHVDTECVYQVFRLMDGLRTTLTVIVDMLMVSEEPMAVKPSPTLSFANKSAWIRALRLVITVLATTYVCLWLELPLSVQPVIAAILVAIQPDLAASMRKMGTRLIGVIIGSVIAFMIAIVVGHTESAIIFVTLYFAAMVGCFYFAYAGEDYSYSGLQAAVAIVLVVGASLSPADLSLPILLQRTAGVFIGIIMGMMVVFAFFADSPERQLSRMIAQSIKDCAQTLKLFLGNASTDVLTHVSQKLLRDRDLASDSLFDMKFYLLSGHRFREYYAELVVHVMHIEQVLLRMSHTLTYMLAQGHSVQVGYYQRTISALKALLDQWSVSVEQQHFDVDYTAIEHIAQAHEAHYLQLRADKAYLHLSGEELIAYTSLMLSLVRVIKSLQDMSKVAKRYETV